MTYYRLKSTPQKTSFILQKTNYPYINPDPQKQDYKPRQLSKINSDSYQRSLRRAFSRAKLLAFFNPDLTQFITLTYKINQQDPQKTIQDIKNLIKYQTKLKTNYSQGAPTTGKKQTPKTQYTVPPELSTGKPIPTALPVGNSKKRKNLPEPLEEVHRNKANSFKYIYVMELQKRGAVHVHMICNDWLEYEKVGKYVNVVGWSHHGFSDVRTIKDFDMNFKPYLYLFKYMQKAQRVGKSFIHASRNFDKIEALDYDQYIDKLDKDNILYKEDHEFTINDKKCIINKEYYRKSEKNDSKKEITI